MICDIVMTFNLSYLILVILILAVVSDPEFRERHASPVLFRFVQIQSGLPDQDPVLRHHIHRRAFRHGRIRLIERDLLRWSFASITVKALGKPKTREGSRKAIAYESNATQNAALPAGALNPVLSGLS